MYTPEKTRRVQTNVQNKRRPTTHHGRTRSHRRPTIAAEREKRRRL